MKRRIILLSALALLGAGMAPASFASTQIFHSR